MSPSLHDFPVPHDKDEVGIADGAQAVGDDEGRPPSHEAEHCVLDGALGVGVDVARGFIKNEDPGFLRKARAMARSWRCPWLRFSPPSERTVSYPSGRLRMKS